MAAMCPDEQAIFEIARKIGSREVREVYLQQICGDDAAIGQRVRALLKAYEENASFLESPAPGLVSTTDTPIPERPGTLIGPYKLLEQIGEGGFGVVFMAEQQEPIRRKVALKIIKPGMDTKQVIARFEAERQALALMDHANIAKVLDAGTIGVRSEERGVRSQESGVSNQVAAEGLPPPDSSLLTPHSFSRPYFVMELVKGLPITEFCDQSRLTLKERLELFGHVCRAVQHAHQKGIIHRDIKPSNVLVTMQDGAPLVKVIDFGIAKALGQQLTDKTLFTNFAQMIGTPLYMSPEQAALSNVDVDTRADIYSLGVLLYELLTGTTPFDKERLHTAGYDEMRRIIREEEPPKPSTRLSTLGQKASTVSAQRKSDLRLLCKLLRGDLDWIVMKALDKDRGRRYETASAFAADVERYLADEPVLACPPSAVYRVRKFVRRHRAGLLIALVLTAALAVLIGSVGWVLRDQAARETEITRQVQDSLTAARALMAADQPAMARQKLAEAKGLIGSDRRAFAGLTAEVEAFEAELDRLQKFTDLVDQSYQKEISEISVSLSLGANTAPGELLLKALECYEVLEPKDWITPLEHSVLGKSQVKQICRIVYEQLLRLANFGESDARRALIYLGIAEKAHVPTAAFYRIRAKSHKDLGEEDAARADEDLANRTPPSMAVDCFLKGQIIINDNYYLTRDVRSAEAVNALDEGLRLEPTHFWSMMKLGNALTELGFYSQEPENYKAAVRVFSSCIMQRPEYAPAHQFRAEAYEFLDRFQEAVDDLSKAIELNPKEAGTWSRRAYAHVQLRQWDKALVDFTQAVELGRKLWDLENRGFFHLSRGHSELALADFTEAVGQFFTSGIQSVHPVRGLAVAYSRLGQSEQAIAHLTKIIDRVIVGKGYELDKRGEFYARLGKWQNALDDHSKAIELYGTANLRNKNVRVDVSAFWNNRGLAHANLGQREEALADFSKAIDLDKGVVRRWSGQGYYAKLNLGLSEKALAELTKAVELEPKNAENADLLAWLLATHADPKVRDPRRALELAKEAVAQAPKKNYEYWITLGAAYYRAGDWRAALEALNRFRASWVGFERRSDSFGLFFIAMANWKLGHKDEALRVYREAVNAMNIDEPNNDELRRFRAEAAELLGTKD